MGVDRADHAAHDAGGARPQNPLAAIGRRQSGAGERLEAVLEGYALIAHERHRSDSAALLHRDEQVAHAQHQLQSFIRDLLVEGARSGDLRKDVAPDELASYCLHALTAASTLRSKAAVRRLVAVTLAGLRPPQRAPSHVAGRPD